MPMGNVAKIAIIMGNFVMGIDIVPSKKLNQKRYSANGADKVRRQDVARRAAAGGREWHGRRREGREGDLPGRQI